MTTYESKFITAAGLKTHYIEAGQGVPMVLVHGGGAGADAIGNWTTTIPELTAHFRVFAVDMVGFGKTEVPAAEDYVYSQDARDNHLLAFIENLDIGRVILVGNSMGGLTSLGVARRRPELVSKLVLMGSAGIKMHFSPELLSIVNYDFTPAGMARIVKGLTGPSFVPPEGLVEYRYNLTATEEARRAYNGIIAWQKLNGGLHTDEDHIRSISIPTLVVAGKKDLVVPLSSAYRFLELIPQSWGAIMPDCGHWPMIEQPRQFAALVKTFAL